jgi:hypothetical protein
MIFVSVTALVVPAPEVADTGWGTAALPDPLASLIETPDFSARSWRYAVSDTAPGWLEL